MISPFRHREIALTKGIRKQLIPNRILLLLAVSILPSLSLAQPSQPKTTVKENIKIINDNLDTYRGVLDFDIERAERNLINAGDECLDEVSAFIDLSSNVRNRRIIGCDILFGIDTDKSLTVLLDLFREHYNESEDKEMVSPMRLSYSSLNFEKSSPQKQMDAMFAYYIFKEALLRSNRVADEIEQVVPKTDRLFKGLIHAYSILSSDKIQLDELPSDDVYVAQGLAPFLKKIKSKAETNQISLEQYRQWYLAVLKHKDANTISFVQFFNEVISADSDYVLSDDVFVELVGFLEKEKCKQKVDLLRAKRRLKAKRGSMPGNDKKNTR